MVVACRTQQLIKTGKNVTISKKFSYSTGNQPICFKNYVEKNSVPRKDIPKVRLHDFKRFHSSRESRTTLAKLTPQELCNCAPSDGPVDLNNVNELLENPDFRIGVLSGILQNQGSSLGQVEEIIASSNGNLEQAVNGINSELKESVLRVDGDAVRINADGLRNLIRDSIQASIRNRLSNNPGLASALQDSLEQEVNSDSSQFNLAVQESAVPLNVAQQALSVSRRKRSLEPRFINLGEIVTNLISDLLLKQLGPIITGLLDNVKNILGGLLIVTASGDPFLDFLAGIVNFVIKGGVQLITIIEQTLTGAVSTVADATARRKRDVTALEGTSPEDTNNDSGLLDVIVRPILTLLASILTPVNALLKNILAGISNTVRPVLGSLILTRLNNILNALIDLLIPANPI